MKMFNFKSLFLITLLLLSSPTFSQTTSENSDNCPLYFSELNVCAKFKWISGPHLNQGSHRRGHRSHHSMNMKKYSTLDILFYKLGDNSFTPLNFPFIKIYPWMIMHGMEHGSRPVLINKLPNGAYRVSKIMFTKMSHGYWEMRFKINEEIEQYFDPKLDYDLKFRVHFNNSPSHGHHH